MRTQYLLGALVLASALTAQTKVYYPDNALNGPQGQYPIFTPTNGNTVRLQLILPGNFSGLPKTGGLVTRMGCQIAGQEDYTTFVIRCGITKQTTLSTTFTTNLPDQRVQVDLSGTKLKGGLSGQNQVNKWVEFELCNPFFWNPGDYVCIDFTSKSKVAGTYCRTAIGSGVPRMLNLSYTSTTTTGSAVGSGGIKFMMVIETPGKLIPYDKGCPGTNNQTPVLSARGSTKLASGPLFFDLSKALPTSRFAFAIGIQCQNFRLGNDCRINPSLDVLVFGSTNASGAASIVTVVPSSSTLRGLTIYTQFAVNDPKGQPIALSNSGIVVLN